MKIPNKVLLALLAIITTYAIWSTISANKLRVKLASSEKAQQRMLEKQRQMHEFYRLFASKSAMDDKTFRHVLAALESQDAGTEFLISNDAATTRYNKVSVLRGN